LNGVQAPAPTERPRRAGAPVYRHTRYDELVIFEFLLPLAREETLRRALDHLFYADSIECRLRAIGIDRLEEIIPRGPGLCDDAYLARITAMVGERFGGYSIGHVAGRYRAGALLSRREAADVAAADGRYLVDETTAVVRFIVRCTAARTDYEPHVGPLRGALDAPMGAAGRGPAIADELRLIRGLFFELFAEAVVHMVEGEDEIWLLETGPERHLYAWERVP
jgi:hypothetical protein